VTFLRRRVFCSDSPTRRNFVSIMRSVKDKMQYTHINQTKHSYPNIVARKAKL